MATKYKSKFTGEQIDNSVETIVFNTATDGQVLTANGTGGATWQDAKGTEVVANPVLSGTESDLTGLEVAGTKYKVPSGGGTEVVANPTLAGTETDLTGLEVAGTKYKVPSGGTENALVKPLTPPTVIELVGIDTGGNQVRIQVDTTEFVIDGTTSPYTLKKKVVPQGETWLLNEVVSTIGNSFNVNFTSKSTQFHSIVLTPRFVPDNPLYFDETLVYNDSGWKDKAYRTVTFETATTGELLTWLQENGVKQ